MEDLGTNENEKLRKLRLGNVEKHTEKGETWQNIKLMEGIQELKRGQYNYQAELKTVRKEYKKIKTELSKLKEIIENIKEKLKNNLIVTGFNMADVTLKENFIDFTKIHLGIDVQVKTVHKLGPKKGTSEMKCFEEAISVKKKHI